MWRQVRHTHVSSQASVSECHGNYRRPAWLGEGGHYVGKGLCHGHGTNFELTMGHPGLKTFFGHRGISAQLFSCVFLSFPIGLPQPLPHVIMPPPRSGNISHHSRTHSPPTMKVCSRLSSVRPGQQGARQNPSASIYRIQRKVKVVITGNVFFLYS